VFDGAADLTEAGIGFGRMLRRVPETKRSYGRTRSVPTLFRLLFIVGLLVALAYCGMLALVTFVHPEPHEIVQSVALPKQPR
jgi:amino acid permease